MNPRHTPLQSWERAALNRYARQNHFEFRSDGAFWHTFGALLRGANAGERFARSHFTYRVAPSRTCLMPLAAVKIEHRLVSLFAE